MKKTLILIFLVFGCCAGAQDPAKDGLVKWYSFSEAQELNKKTPKPFLIDMYTDWCGWCKHMIKTTYSDPSLSSYINNYFYPIKFNAETKDTIVYNGVKYWNESSAPKSPHQLARKFLGSSLTYPSTLFVNGNFQFNLLTQGYLDVKKIEPLLIYTVENVFRTSSYDDFKQMFDRTFYDSLQQNKPDRVKLLSWNEMLELQKKKQKKVIVSTHTNWCSGCRVMNGSTFCDTLVADYLNKNFYVVELNAESKDTLTYNGQKYYPSSNPSFPFHQLVPVLTRNNFILPTLTFLDEAMNLIDALPFYQHPKNLDPVLRYFGTNSYKTVKWEDYLKKNEPKKTDPGKK